MNAQVSTTVWQALGRFWRCGLAALALLLAALLPAAVSAHAGSQSYLTVQVDGGHVEGRLVMSLIDVALALKLDVGAPPEQLRAALAARHDEVGDYVRQRLKLVANGHEQLLDYDGIVDAVQNGEDFVIAGFKSDAPAAIEQLDIGYTLFFEDDLQHQCLAKIVWGDAEPEEVVFTVGTAYQPFSHRASGGRGFWQFLKSGVWHIWIGYDHILFLIALLIPAVFTRTASGRAPVPTLMPAILRVTTIVTAFTLAHSITLSCAVLGWVHLPSHFVESAIAASVFIAAAYNFLPRTAGISGAWLAFAFGLLHGFGFASVLSELDLGSQQIWRPLVAFNLGVEIGQLAIVAVFFPLAYRLRATRFYRIGVVRGGSAAVCACAAVWFYLRAF
ncbi:HupE/UreJ family protein [Solimonas flava]|uniref:HupE/UreJ family protein n=1 Tax=Solimonas flava TaxID=415849 RepID=UPI00137671EC|nr:HupE/UreJ family protein [Solimonas flava]